MEQHRKYLDMLMCNYPLQSDSDDESQIQRGGKSSNSKTGRLVVTEDDKPFGGFPPIFLCANKKDLTKETKEREYEKQATSISIKDIMKKRRNDKPFL